MRSRARARVRIATAISHEDPSSIDRLPELPGPLGGLTGSLLSGLARADATASSVLGALPGTWCGTERSTDDTADQLQNGTYRYHAIYALPAGTADRFSSLANTLQADAFEASELLERLYGRAIRFDMGTSCGPQFLDISVVRLAESASALSSLSADSNALLSRLTDELSGAGFDPLPLTTTTDVAAAKTTNYLVWMDGVSPPGGGVCGVGTEFDDTTRDPSNFNNYGGKLAVVFTSGTGFCNSDTVRHEIGHNLGALQADAPHAFDGAHCNDAYEDTMCYPNSPVRAGGGFENQYFDYGNDDYWDPAGGSLRRWTVNLNRFLCPDVVCNVPADNSLLGTVGKLTDGADVFDQDGDTTKDLYASCPLDSGSSSCRSNAGTSGSEVTRRRPPAPTLTFAAKRRRKGSWKVKLVAQGSGKLQATVSCRRRRRPVTVVRKRLSAPQSVAAQVRCDSKPRAKATLL